MEREYWIAGLHLPPDLTDDQIRAEVVARLRLNTYMGGKVPTAPQVAFMLAPQPEVLFGGAAGPGKALALDMPLPTPTGWTTMGAVQVGDWLLDEQGHSCRVTGTSPVLLGNAVYDVEFDDGSMIRADGGHLWLTATVQERAAWHRLTPEYRARRRALRPSRANGTRPHVTLLNQQRAYTYKDAKLGTVRTTEEIATTLRHHNRANHTVALCQPLQLPEYPLPVDPYVLGVWLGDGHSAGGAITSNDLEIVEAVAAAGIPIHKTAAIYAYGTYGLTPVLRKLNVLNNKHIPAMYLRASAEQRWALLQGLMDTDGTVDRDGRCEFSVVNRQLAADVHELLHTLGIRAAWREGRATIYGKDCGARYRLGFETPMPVFRLTRKLERQMHGPPARPYQHRTIVDVRPVPTEPVKCVTVDSPSHLYLASRAMIPTHNSTGALFLALQYVDVPGYAALIVRRTFQQLSKPGGLMSKAREWLAGTNAKWSDETRTWYFPTRDPARPASLTFGHLENPGSGPDDLGDEVNFQGQEYQTIVPDELTQLPTPWPYLYLMTRLRRLKENPVPVRMRPTTNPGGVGHDWVKARYIDTTDPDRLFIPARGKDNPHLDWASYLRGLGQMDPVTQAQLIDGNWYVRPKGTLFTPERIRVVPPLLGNAGVRARIRYWDKAGSEGTGAFTAGILMARVDKAIYGVEYVIENIIRGQWSAGRRNLIIRRAADLASDADLLSARLPLVRPDSAETVIWLEQEGGSGGKESAEISVSELAGREVHIERPTGDKAARARSFASQIEFYNVGMVAAPWNKAYLDELTPAPQGLFWDQIDASSGAFNKLALLVQPALPASSPGRPRELAAPLIDGRHAQPVDPRRLLPAGIGLPPGVRGGLR